MRERRQRAMLYSRHFAHSQKGANHHDSTTTSIPRESSVNINQQIMDQYSDESDDDDDSNNNDGNAVNAVKENAQKNKRRIPIA